MTDAVTPEPLDRFAQTVFKALKDVHSSAKEAVELATALCEAVRGPQPQRGVRDLLFALECQADCALADLAEINDSLRELVERARLRRVGTSAS